MSRKVTDGNAITFITPVIVEENKFYNINDFFGLCLKSAQIGEYTCLEIGLFTYETTQIKDEEYLIGNILYWDNTAELLTKVVADIVVGKVIKERVIGEPLLLQFLSINKSGFPA